jgi:hypothetical protein
MLHSLTRRFKQSEKFLGLLLAVMALMGQLAVGAAVPLQDEAAERLNTFEAALILCHSGTGSTPSQQAPLHHHFDCALCPLCQVLAHYSVVLTSAPFLPEPPAGMTLRTRGVAAARAPPAPAVASAYPRGPPSLA